MAAAAAGSAWLSGRRQPEASLRLICLPHAGSGGSVFADWPKALPEVEVIAVSPPGREANILAAPIDRLEPLVEALADELSAELDKPFALFGHSLGALVAFELTRELRRRSWPQPRLLFASARPAPQLKLSPREYALSDEELLAVLAEWGGMPEEVLAEPELMEILLPAAHADVAVSETFAYRPEPPLDLPLSVFGGVDDVVTRAELEAWSEQTTAAFSLRVLSGGHLYVRDDPRELLGHLRADLAASLADAAAPRPAPAEAQLWG